MKKTAKIIFLAFMLISIAAMFLPVASFHDNTAASLQADIDKHIHVLEYDRRDPSHVPESVEDGVMLIVVR